MDMRIEIRVVDHDGPYPVEMEKKEFRVTGSKLYAALWLLNEVEAFLIGILERQGGK